MKRTLIFLISLFLFEGCIYKDHAFIYDPADPRLPQYSEEGANTAGALIGGHPWTSRRNLFRSVYDGDYASSENLSILKTDSVYLPGALITINEGIINQNGSEQNVALGFFLKGLDISGVNDIVELEGQEFILDGENSFGQIEYSDRINSIDEDHRGIGKFFIRTVDVNHSGELFLSGTFGFAVDFGADRTEVFSGRYDFQLFSETIGLLE